MRLAHHPVPLAVAIVLIITSLQVLPTQGMTAPVVVQSTDIVSVAQQSGVSAALHEGDCTAIGAVVAPFTNAIVPSGSLIGNSDALPAATSFTTVPLPLDMLLASDHAVVVADPGDDGALACGEIGGFVAEDGSLSIGLESRAVIRGSWHRISQPR